MNKPWTIDDTRRVIGVLMIALSLFFFWSFLKGHMMIFEILKSQNLALFDFALNLAIKYFATIILYILILLAGINLLLNSKFGWILSLVVLINLNILYIYRLFTYQNFTIEIYTIFSLITVGCLGSIIFLLSKPFRIKHTPRKTTWIIISIAACSLFLIQMV